MASFEQDFIIFDEDRLLLQYTFTDLETNFNSNWAAWWGAAENSTWPDTATIIREKATSNWTNGPTSPDDNNITLVNGDVIVRVFFTQTDFGDSVNQLDKNTEYYTELVVSNNAGEDFSVVAATGILYVSQSMFTEASYR